MLPRIEAYVDRFGLGDARRLDDGTLLFERDIVWRPLEQAWQVLVGPDAGYLEPGSPAPALAAPAGGVVTHVEPEHVLELDSPDGPARWEFSADPRRGHRVRLSAHGEGQAWQEHIGQYFARVLGGM